MNVLIVDDSKIIRTVLKATVERFSLQKDWSSLSIFEADDGTEAMEIMQKHPIDIMFLDWNMPYMNGDEVVTKVRQNKAWNKTRIIMATTEGEKSLVMKMLKMGVNGYLVKPLKEANIFKALGNITARMAR